MSDFTDNLIRQYLRRENARQEAYPHDPARNMQIKWTRQFLAKAEDDMAAEGVPQETRRRVLTRLIFSGPEMIEEGE